MFQLAPRSGSRLGTVTQQAAVVDRDGLGGAGASAAVRTAEGVAAALEDDGWSRAASQEVHRHLLRGGASDHPIKHLIVHHGHKKACARPVRGLHVALGSLSSEGPSPTSLGGPPHAMGLVQVDTTTQWDAPLCLHPGCALLLIARDKRLLDDLPGVAIVRQDVPYS